MQQEQAQERLGRGDPTLTLHCTSFLRLPVPSFRKQRRQDLPILFSGILHVTNNTRRGSSVSSIRLALMGLCPPYPPGFIAVFFQSGWFGLVVISDCRTMERLDRRIGQRRDATRAPTQARSGWRPSGRLLDSPPRHLRIGKILSKQWGPPHT